MITPTNHVSMMIVPDTVVPTSKTSSTSSSTTTTAATTTTATITLSTKLPTASTSTLLFHNNSKTDNEEKEMDDHDEENDEREVDDYDCAVSLIQNNSNNKQEQQQQQNDPTQQQQQQQQQQQLRQRKKRPKQPINTISSPQHITNPNPDSNSHNNDRNISNTKNRSSNNSWSLLLWWQRNRSNTKRNNNNSSNKKNHPKSQAIRYMTYANAFHFASYECSRIGTMALFTSHRYGFQSVSTVSLATGFVSPFSIFLLWAYATLFDQLGPRKSLLYTTIFYSCIVGMIGFIIELIDPWLVNVNNTTTSSEDHSTTSYMLQILSRILVFTMFIMKNSFVHLFYTQHWSFISSIFHTKQQSTTSTTTTTNQHNVDGDINADSATTWFPIISGIASISATACAYGMTQPIVQQTLYLEKSHRLLYVSSIMNIICAILADRAYDIAEKNDFVPSKEKKQISSKKTNITESNTILSSTTDGGESDSDNSNHKKESLIQRAMILFRRVPILKGLCIEVLFCQAVSSVLCYLFVSTTKKVFLLQSDDKERSQFTGKVYASINLGSGILEFFVLPLTLKYMKGNYLWLLMPSIVMILVASITQTSTHNNLQLSAVTISFVIMKILEYSFRGVVTEMVYTSLDYESRFFGKEIVTLVANRFGKSGTAIVLAIVSMNIDSSYFDTKIAPFALVIFTLGWLLASNNIVNLLTFTNTKSSSCPIGEDKQRIDMKTQK